MKMNEYQDFAMEGGRNDGDDYTGNSESALMLKL